jgi:hypothetical protein
MFPPMPPFLSSSAVFLALAAAVSAALPDAAQIDRILAVEPNGKGNAEASAAVKAITAAGAADSVPALLAAMNRANPLAANWLRGTVSAIVQKSGGKLPPEPLAAFAKDATNRPPGRILAMDLLRASDEAAWNALIPSFLEDPASELRREPVQRLITAAKASNSIPDLRKALNAARDEDQIREAADALREKGESVDLPKHFGFLMNWQVAAPFDNSSRKGFNTAFPPESKIDLAASYPGKELKAGDPTPVTWKPAASSDQFGVLDFNKATGMIKDATAYAYTTFESTTERDAEIRLGCKNAWKIWLNGDLVFGRDEYHRGKEIDQYRLPVKLRKGPNTILVKCCQNEQTETWTVEWEFQLRICDSTGTAILDPNRPATPPAALGTPEKGTKD